MTATIQTLPGLAGLVLGFAISILGLYYMRASSLPGRVRGFVKIFSLPFIPPLLGLSRRKMNRYYFVYGAVVFVIGLAFIMLFIYLLTPESLIEFEH